MKFTYSALLFILIAFLFACENSGNSRLDSSPESSDPFDSLNTLIKASPNQPDLYFERAKIHYDLRDLPSSLSDIGRALKLDSNKADYYLLLANLKIINKQSREGRDALLKAYKIDPTNADVLLKLGELYMIVEDAESSFKYLNEALKIDVYNASAYRIKGFNYKFLGDTVSCISSFQTAVEIDPNDYDSYLQLALLYSQAKHELALAYFDNALKVRPTSLEALYGKGFHLQNTGDYRNAIRAYDQIISLNEKFFNAFYNKGYIYLEHLAKFDSAAFNFTKAIENGPTNYVDAVFNRGLSYERSMKLEQAELAYREALRIDPQYDNAALGLSRLLE